MKELLMHTLIHTLSHTLTTIPFLFIVYLLIEYLQHKMSTRSFGGSKLDRFGPLIGAGVGSIPQCGFSAASAALYNERLIGGGTLIAVFLATSDEAIPLILANINRAHLVLYLIAAKIVMAVVAGYILKFTVFAKEVVRDAEGISSGNDICDDHHHNHDHEHKGSFVAHAVSHTIKISIYILITVFVIELAMHSLGEERLAALLLSGSILQPFVTALIGIIPGCSTSVLLTELMLSGSITFGSAMAGLGTGAGFGYIVLFRGSGSKMKTLKIIGLTYLSAVVSGVIINLLPLGI